MENPFQYLVSERRRHLGRAYQKQKESSLERSRLKSNSRERSLERAGFEALVSEALEQLQQAAYPGLSVRSGDQTWSIGKWFKRNDSSVGWMSFLAVRLIQDELTGTPLCFECIRHHRKVQAELSRESLLDALQQLYPVSKRDPSARPAIERKYDELVNWAFADVKLKVNLELHLLADHKKWVIGIWQLRGEALEWRGLVEIHPVYNWRRQVKAFNCLSNRLVTRVEPRQAKLSDALFSICSSFSGL